MHRPGMNIVMLSAVFITAMLCSHAGMAQESTEAAEIAPAKSAPPMAPDFVLKDLTGKERSLKEFRGKVVLLNFTTTWCPYCKKDIPNLKKFHTSMKGRKDFELISIYVNESPKRVAAFAKKYSLPFTILVDDQIRAARTYGVQGVPMKVVVDKKGVIGCWQCISAEDKVREFLKIK